MIAAMLDLSTFHLPPDHGLGDSSGPIDANNPRTRYVAHDHGWTFYLGDAPREGDPPWLRDIITYALTHECMIVNFDSAGDLVAVLPTFDW